MRVVHVANAYTPRSGGIRTTVHALGHGYQAAGHEFVLVVPGPRAGDEELPWGRRLTLAGPRVPRSRGYRILADLRRVRIVLDALEPDRLEVSDRLTLRGLGRRASAAGVPSTVIAHERATESCEPSRRSAPEAHSSRPTGIMRRRHSGSTVW